MNADQKNKIKAAQLNALLAKLNDKKPLTAAQLEYIADNFPDDAAPGAVAKASGNSPDYVAISANDLAKRLGIHRQIIAYHKGRDGSPKTLSVAAWKSYLSIMGKLPTAIKMEGSHGSGSSAPFTEPFDADTAFAILFHDLSNVIGAAVKHGLMTAGVKLSPRKVDAVAWGAWLVLAARYQRTARENDSDGPFDPVDESGRCDYPPGIVTLAARVDKLMAKNPAPAAPDVES